MAALSYLTTCRPMQFRETGRRERLFAAMPVMLVDV